MNSKKTFNDIVVNEKQSGDISIFYLRITFDNKHLGDCPDEAAYNVINYFSVNQPNQDYQFIWNSDTEFITEKFIEKQTNFNNNSIDMAILDTNNNIGEIKSIIKEFVSGCVKLKILDYGNRN